ncbi:hypothetical protein PHYC_03235 [Phycisphaerales bacterium]|nr:hypothetical protein PHYC_03235 [Phycisphaerales bacterium]
MCNWKTPLAIGGLMAVAFVAGRTLPVGPQAEGAQPEKPKATQPDKPGAGQPAFEAPKPGTEHKLLDGFLGTWEGGGKMWMAPDQSPMEFNGSATRTWVLDGMWVKEDVQGPPSEHMPVPFKGLGMIGYNTAEKKYEMLWFENMATWHSSATGTYDAAKKVFTFQGDCIDPMTQRRMKSRSTWDISNPTRHVFTGWAVGPDGKEFKNFEGTFEKKK